MSALANWSNLIRPSVAASIYLLIGIFPTTLQSDSLVCLLACQNI